MPSFQIRDPVHGFIEYDEWERGVINHPAFQRLRRIRQLALADFVYPGATHTRFEHALGTMHVATKMYDAIVARQRHYLESKRGYDQAGLERDRRVVRFAALLHDIGHSPFSHSSENLFPLNDGDDRRYQHEDYSASIIRKILKDAIEGHSGNSNYGIMADDVADLIVGGTDPARISQGTVRRLLWRPIVTSQLDADRADYLLRDSLHAGVSYGRYDLDRILATVTLGLGNEDDPAIAIEEGGWHAAEGLIIARYMMFTQVYFHHVRQALDHHIEGALAHLLSNGQDQEEQGVFPKPNTIETLQEYLDWDDWKVLGEITSGNCGEHGEFIKQRKHYRRVWNTGEVPTDEEIQELETYKSRLENLVTFTGDASKSWYSLGGQDLLIVPNDSDGPVRGAPLSQYSSVVRNLSSSRQQGIYVKLEDRQKAEEILWEITMKRQLHQGNPHERLARTKGGSTASCTWRWTPTECR